MNNVKLSVKFIGMIFCGFYFPLVTANQATPIPGSKLEDFFNAAINFSPDLRIAEENLNIGSARKKAANGQLLPQINAGASISDNRLNQFNTLQTFSGERYYLGLSQTLFNWQQFAARKQARFEENQLEEEYYYQLASLLTDVADRYFNVLQAEDALDSISAEIEALTNQLDQIQSLYDRQLAQITDLYQGQASLAAAQAELLQLEAQFAINQESLRSISGLDVGPLYQLGDEAKIPPLEYNQQYYVQQARENNHRILAGEYALKAADQNISGRRGAYMPQVSFIAQRQDSDVGFDNLPINRQDNTYIGLNVSIPIYAGGSTRAGVSEALSQRSIAEYQLRAAQLQARELVRSAHLRVQASESQTDAARILVESTALAAEAMQQGFALGTVTSVDVLNALRDQYQAERELQRIRYEHIRYLLLLKRETGTLTAEDMLEVGSWLTPETPQ
jgi:outer membrane protein